MKATPRSGISHFNVSDFEDDLFVLENVRLKVDGFRFCFGRAQNGMFFTESSRSGPIYVADAYKNYDESRNKANGYGKHYTDLHNLIENSLLGQAVQPGMKVLCECIYLPMGTGVIIKYPEDNLSLVNLFPFAIEGIHKDYENLGIDLLSNFKDDKIKVFDSLITECLELYSVPELDSDLLDILKYRMNDIIKSSVHEGLVFTFKGKEYKITTDGYKFLRELKR